MQISHRFPSKPLSLCWPFLQDGELRINFRRWPREELSIQILERNFKMPQRRHNLTRLPLGISQHRLKSGIPVTFSMHVSYEMQNEMYIHTKNR